MGWIASILTFLGLLLNARKVRASWWVWIVGDLLWAIHGIAINDPSIVVLNVVFIFLNYYGWWKWRPAKVRPAKDSISTSGDWC